MSYCKDMSKTLYHGAHTRFALHVGICLTDREESARTFSQRAGELAEVELDMSALTVVDVDGYDRDEDEALGDRAADAVDADVIVFDDEDMMGQSCRCWRLMSQRAVAAVTVTTVESV